MQEINPHNQIGSNYGRSIKILPIVAIWLLVFIAGSLYLIVSSEELNPIKQYFLVPWVILTGVTIGIPIIYFWYRKQFKLYNPLIYAACSYFLPSFVLGGFILANGWSEPYFLSLIQDPQTDLPFTMLIVILGFAGLSVGFIVPFGKFIGNKIDRILPKWEWETEKLFTACYILLGIGIFNTIIGYGSGVLGYQRLDEVGIFDGILFLLTLVWMEATFLLWLVIFRRNKLDFKSVIAIVILLTFALIKAFYAGNRGGLFSIFMIVMLAYFLSGRKITLKQGFLGTALLILSLFFGMIYGTTFRNLRQSESQVGMEQYTENIFATFDAVSERDNIKTLEQGFSGLAERLDAVSSLAVVVSNYEQLAPYEESYGLDNNIWKDTVTFFIPRVIWNEKPLASEPRKYSELYFNFGENSFPVTPMGDLLRNYGVFGVFIGMVLLGIFIRLLYSALIENKEFSYWKTTLFFMLLTAISYEGFYGTIIPYVLKVFIISIIGLVIVNFVVKKQSKTV
jgi:hypothetical protein